MTIIITFLIALFGAWAGKKLQLPSGIIIGAIITVSIANLIFGLSEVPAPIKLSTQIVAGAFVGAGLDRQSLHRIRQLLKPAAIMMTALLTMNLTLGLLLYRVSPLNLTTALFATVPGGLAEMSVISEQMGADPAIVSVFHLARLIVTVGTFPFAITHIMKADKASLRPAGESKHQPELSMNQKTKADLLSRLGLRMSSDQWKHFLITMTVATAAGILGQVSGFPGGMLLFSALSAGALKLLFGIGLIPKWAKQLAQVIVGAYIGAKVSWDVIWSIAQIWPYILMVVTVYLLVCLMTGYFISRTCNLDKVTAAFASAPAGASDMALIASDYEVETSAIAILQMIRLLLVIALCPTLITILLRVV